jgi:DNA-binding response OmpR family regulator
MNEDKISGQVVLIVDENADTRTTVKQFLELEGYRAVEAASGEEAVEVALGERPRLVLLDLSTSYIEALTTARRLREEPELNETKVVIISALDISEVQEVIGEGYGYLPKPIDFAHLKALISITFEDEA